MQVVLCSPLTPLLFQIFHESVGHARATEFRSYRDGGDVSMPTRMGAKRCSNENTFTTFTPDPMRHQCAMCFHITVEVETHRKPNRLHVPFLAATQGGSFCPSHLLDLAKLLLPRSLDFSNNITCYVAICFCHLGASLT